MKRNKILLALILAFCLVINAGCAPAEDSASGSSSDTSSDIVSDTSSDPTDTASIWEDIRGSYVWDQSGQYTNATLALMDLDNGCVLFEFDLMEGSETEDNAMDLTVPGVFTVQEDGTGLYQATAEDGKTNLSITFTLSADGQEISVSHEGDLPISPDGSYSFVESALEMSDTSAEQLIRFLPTNLTSLNANNGAYTLQPPEGLVADWFYPVKATLDDSGAVLAEFVVAKDFSAVFRVDEDIEPVLIYGSAVPMMEAEVWQQEDGYRFEFEDAEDSIPEAEEELFEADEMEQIDTDEPEPLVSVSIKDGSFIELDQTAEFEVHMPWELSYTIEAISVDSSIVAIQDGKLAAVGVGETEVYGTLTIADAQKEFSMIVTVLDGSEHA